MSSPGTDLSSTFDKVNVVVGKVGVNVIDGWFDTDNKKLTDFLQFITDYVTEQNSLTPFEVDEYKEFKAEGKILHRKEFDKAVHDVSLNYSGIFDYDDNVTEVNILESEKKDLVEYKDCLNDVVRERRNELKEIERSVSIAKMRELNLNVELEESREVCLNLSVKLDDINTRLCEQFNSYKLSTTPCFISDISSEAYVSLYNDTVSLLQLTDVDDFGRLTIMQSTVKTCRKLHLEAEDENLDLIKHRLFKSMACRRNKEILLARLKEEKKFLRSFDILSLMGLNGNMLSEKSSLESKVYSKGEICNMWVLDFEKKLKESSNKYIDQHMLYTVLENLVFAKRKLSYVQGVAENFLNIFVYYVVLYLLFQLNHAHVKKYYENFRSVHKYVINDVQRCIFRIETMTNIIKEQEQYDKLPHEKRNVLLDTLIHYLSSGNLSHFNLKQAGNYVLRLEKDFQDVQKKLFVDELEVFAKTAKDLVSNAKTLKSFITNGPTSEFILLEYYLCKIFRELDEVFIAQNNSVHHNVDMYKKAMKRVSDDEWFKYKRQLWMYFLMEPKKVPRLINKIEQEMCTHGKENLKCQ